MIDINTLIESGITDFNITIKYSDLVMLGDRLVERILDEVCPMAAENAVEKLLTKSEVMENSAYATQLSTTGTSRGYLFL